MFSKASSIVRESIYGVLCKTPLKGNKTNLGNGTAFMISPGICVTAAHVLHVESDKSKPLHSQIQVIRSPEIGSRMLTAELIAEDLERDIALIALKESKYNDSLPLLKSRIPSGTSCGSLGFPLASVSAVDGSISFNLVERFQGAYISAFQSQRLPNRSLTFYETDSLMYSGSSGCPGYTVENKIFGMHVATFSESKGAGNSSRLAISLWVPSEEIISIAEKNSIEVTSV